MTGTIKPVANFNANADAEALRKAMKGMGTDEKVLIEILGTRSNEQIQAIVLAFKTQFGKDLADDLKSETSGNFRQTILHRLYTPTKYDATQLHDAIKGAGTNEKVLIEILCTRNNAEIKAIKEEYKKMFSKDLEKDIVGDTSGHFRRLLVSLVQGARDESTNVDQAAAKADADALYKAGEGQWGTDESKFNQILVSRSAAHLRVVFDEFKKIAKHDIYTSISKEFSGDVEDGMLAVARSIEHAPTYFAERLYKSMKGAGTDDNSLIRLVISRSEIDMAEIKEAFQKKYGKTLASFIQGDTSGDYEKILMKLIGH